MMMGREGQRSREVEKRKEREKTRLEDCLDGREGLAYR